MNLDPLAETVARLIATAPEEWAPTPTRDIDSINRLTAAGLIERRIAAKIKLPGSGNVERIVIEITGEGGLGEAVRSLAARWAEVCAGKFEAGRPVFPIVVVESDEWRLTDQGIIARADLTAGSQVPIDFVLRRGFFNGRPRLVGDRLVQRHVVHGRGRLVGLESVADDKLLDVRVVEMHDNVRSQIAKAVVGSIKGLLRRKTAQKPVGGVTLKVIAALLLHHKFEDGWPANPDPIGVRALARLSGVAPSSVAAFFASSVGFQSFADYVKACRSDRGRLARMLKQLSRLLDK